MFKNAYKRLYSSIKLPELPYAYDALEPVVSKEIMTLHHTKHHQAYVNGFNTAHEQMMKAESSSNVERMVELQSMIKFNGGGHVNHSLFWQMLTPAKDFAGPTGSIAKAIDHSFGGLDAFISRMNTAATAVQGSGWAWLALDLASPNAQSNASAAPRLLIATTPNQDPCATLGYIPLLGIDVWEHAYYPQYKNARAEYLKQIWKIINWQFVNGRLEEALQKK